MQKQHKEEERKQREAEKAAEEAEQKLKQQMQEDEMRKRREEERARREALRKQQEEERLKKEEERRKRQAEERERQAEQERKKKEREERAKAERRDREEKERKAKEEREAKLAAEKAAAAAKREQQEREEREKRLAKELKEAEERERKERERLRQVANPPKNRGPPGSPRNAVPSGTSRNVPVGPPKKILQKPMPAPVVIASSSSSSTQAVTTRPSQQRPAINTQAQVNAAPQPQYPGIPSTSHLQSPGPSTTPILASFQSQFPSPGGPMSATMSPRPGPPFSNGPIVPPYMSYGLPGGSVTPGLPTPGIGPPRGYPVAPSTGYESFRPLAPLIAPPSKGLSNPPGSPIGTMFNATPGAGPSTNHLRRGSAAERPATGGSFGVVQRPPAPIAPIARPYAKEDEKSTNSPKLKSPRSTPGPSEPVLGSSALVADDDEPIMPPNRRVAAGAVGQVWGAPGTDTRPNWPGGQGVSFGGPGRTSNGLWGTAPDQWQSGFPPHTPFTSNFSTHSPPPGGN